MGASLGSSYVQRQCEGDACSDYPQKYCQKVQTPNAQMILDLCDGFGWNDAKGRAVVDEQRSHVGVFLFQGV